MEMIFIDKIKSEVVTLHTMNTMAVHIHNLRTIWGWVVSFMLRLLWCLKKELMLPIEQGTLWASEPILVL